MVAKGEDIGTSIWHRALACSYVTSRGLPPHANYITPLSPESSGMEVLENSIPVCVTACTLVRSKDSQSA